ncbi:hypothetical protein [Acidovorax sp. Leaf78]|uniref:hypothetical protein n=1 Tax=Acidovorax sp. Leaf78 TaxID=1736237 RepID=UPI0006FD1E14|nr:hypothetical protein [Acidovorax sp. Leaf78]KQO15908.1 hypothetical protein ASF16_14925 [Acidovorax sp. Leaf78]
MLFTVLAYLLIAALVVVGLGVLLLPVYVWVQHRDAMRAPQRALQLAESDLLLAETEAMLASPPAR